MDIQTAVKTVLQKYATVTGRAARSEYWYWVLFTIIVGVILGFVDGLLFGVDPVSHKTNSVLGMIFSLATLVPGICVGVRRLHDIGKSGWWLLINLIPLVGWILFIVWAATKGTTGDNRFGADPLAGTPAA